MYSTLHTDLTDHIASVIQKYLRNQYKTIEDYNQAAGEVARFESFRGGVFANALPDRLNKLAHRLRDWKREDWIKAIDANMLTPIEFIKSTVDGMMSRGFGRIVNITSSSVKAPIDILGLSNGARSGLTGFVAGVARVTIKKGVTINGLLPGPFDTDRLRGTMKVRAAKSGRSFEEEYQTGAKAHPAGRFGTAEEFGAMCAFLCSVHASYMTGQNILMDGGQYPGTY